jgi:hypothetical protein
VRWLHIYLSMLGLGALLFFGVTGITLNHPDWFFAGQARHNQVQGTLEPHWLKPLSGETAPDPNADPATQFNSLAVVEHFRNEHGVQGAVEEVSADEYECLVSFKGPGYSADAFIDRETGEYELTETRQGFVAVINDLHKGRHSGNAWSLVIDVSALLTTLISLTGLVLLFYVRRRRRSGLLTALIATLALVAIVVLMVP